MPPEKIHHIVEGNHKIEFVALVHYVAQFAQHIIGSLELLHPNNRQELLNFIEQFANLSPEKFQQDLSATASLSYSHEDIAASINQLGGILQDLGTLFQKMKGLDPSYKTMEVEKVDSTLVEDNTSIPTQNPGGITFL